MLIVIDDGREITLARTSQEVRAGVQIYDHVRMPYPGSVVDEAITQRIVVVGNPRYRGTLRAGTTWTTTKTAEVAGSGTQLVSLGVGVISSRPLLFAPAAHARYEIDNPPPTTIDLPDDEEDEE